MQTILRNVSNKRLKLFAIFLPCIVGDNRDQALERSREFSDPRIVYLWDNQGLTALTWQKTLGLHSIAWDVYLIYGPASKWVNEPEQPVFWMHQLRGVPQAPRLNRPVFESKVLELLRK